MRGLCIRPSSTASGGSPNDWCSSGSGWHPVPGPMGAGPSNRRSRCSPRREGIGPTGFRGGRIFRRLRRKASRSTYWRPRKPADSRRGVPGDQALLRALVTHPGCIPALRPGQRTTDSSRVLAEAPEHDVTSEVGMAALVSGDSLEGATLLRGAGGAPPLFHLRRRSAFIQPAVLVGLEGDAGQAAYVGSTLGHRSCGRGGEGSVRNRFARLPTAGRARLRGRSRPAPRRGNAEPAQ